MMLMVPAVGLFRELERGEEHPAPIIAVAPTEEGGEITIKLVECTEREAMKRVLAGETIYTTAGEGIHPAGGGPVYTETNPPALAIGPIRKPAARFVETKLAFWVNYDETVEE